MELVLLIGGLILGYAVAIIRRSSSGTLRIDHSDPEKDKYRFEIDDLDSLDRKKRIILEIDHDANLSQK